MPRAARALAADLLVMHDLEHVHDGATRSAIAAERVIVQLAICLRSRASGEK